MRRWRCAGAAAAAAAIFVVCWVDASLHPARANDDKTTMLLFSGHDIWRNSAFLYGGLLVAPGGFDRDGLMLKLLYSNGAYRYKSGYLGGREVIGAQFVGDLMPGWRIKRHGVEIKFFFGLDVEQHRLWPNDPSGKLRGGAIGARVAAEFWYEPTPATLLTGDISLASIAINNSARLAYGWRVFEDGWRVFDERLGGGGFYLGPEIQYFASDGYRHWRIGSHLTGLKIGRYEWSAAIGWASDSDSRSSPYVRLNFLTRR